MTIANTNNRTSIDGNGVTTSFSVAFPFHSQADLVVLSTVILTGVQTTKTLTTHYTISGTPDALGHYINGGSVDFLVAPAATERITIYRDPSRIQALDLVENDNLPAESLEASIDYQTMLIQRIADLVVRGLRQPDGDSANIAILPSKVDRASMFLGFNSAGDPIASAGTSADLGPVSAFINTLLDDADAAAARATLGITSTSNIDSDFRIVGSGDNTKKYALETDAITTATTRTRFVTDEDANAGQTWEVQNLTLVASVAANALTIAVKTKNGTDPSATDPIILKFRNATVGTGDYATVALTAALSLVISSGSTVGTVSATAHRLYVGVANDAGTLRLFLYNPFVAASVSLTGISDDQVYSSTAEGAAGGADTAQVLYSGAAFTNKPVRVLGYLESTQATAGTWATAVSKLQVMGPGVRRTGEIVQKRGQQTGAVATGTTAMPFDDTIPQITEGDEFLTQAITPKSAINLLSIDLRALFAQSGAGVSVTMALFQDAVANALSAISANNAANYSFPLSLSYAMPAGTVSATTMRMRAGGTGGAAVTFNGTGGARLFGGVANSRLMIEEIFV